jgi:hypothetical protein
MPVNCIRCDRSLESVNGGGHNQPNLGTAFTSYGHDGSMFDPMDGSFLEINICNSCLIEAGNKNQVLAAHIDRNVYIPMLCRLDNGDSRTVYSIIGTINTENYSPVYWNYKLTSLNEDRFTIESTEELKSLWDRIESHFTLEQVISMMT